MFSTVGVTARDGRYSVEAFAALPKMLFASLSPSGSHIGYLAPVSGKNKIFVLARAGGRVPRQIDIDIGSAEIDWFRWASDNQIIASISAPGMRFGAPVKETRLYVVDRDGKNGKSLAFEIDGHTPQVQTDIVDLVIDDPDHILLNVEGRPGGAFNVYHLNIRTPQLSLAHNGKPTTAKWISDRNGEVRVRIDYRNLEKRVYFRRIGQRRFRLLKRFDFFDDSDFSPLGVSADDDTLYIASDRAGGRRSVYQYDAKEKEFGAQLFAHPMVDVTGIIKSPNRGLVGVYFAVDSFDAHYLDQDFETRQATVDQGLRETQNLFVSSSKDDRLHIILASGIRHPGSYYMFDSETGELVFLADKYPQLRPGQLADIASLNFEARDGLEISAYVTLPNGARLSDKKKWPLVVMPHGGPRVRDYQEFDYMSHFLADRGWAVLKPNFRGSGGFGRKFEARGYKEWGAAIQDDITDGARALIKTGFADPSRICIVGGSFGGYSALMGAAREPDLYQCAASLNAVSDLFRMLSDATQYRFYQLAAHRVGHPGRDKALLIDHSPVSHVGRISAPVLLFHGDADRRVPLRHSESMMKALRSAGKEGDLVILKGADHFLSRQSHRRIFLSRLEDFLEGHLDR
jgi:dipeptidyl aminopeptidase/acylaminoacyl peptidase